jgi:hypothetical protein
VPRIEVFRKEKSTLFIKRPRRVVRRTENAGENGKRGRVTVIPAQRPRLRPPTTLIDARAESTIDADRAPPLPREAFHRAAERRPKSGTAETIPFPGADSILSNRCGAISRRLRFALRPLEPRSHRNPSVQKIVERLASYDYGHMLEAVKVCRAENFQSCRNADPRRGCAVAPGWSPRSERLSSLVMRRLRDPRGDGSI